MYFRKVSGKQEVSLDEPLNTDPDGGELLLSDVLGSDEPPMSQAMEEAEERLALRRAVAALEEGVVDRYSTVYCSGVYHGNTTSDAYEDWYYSRGLQCWVYPASHG